MTEKKYIIDEWDVAEIARCAEKACDQKLAEYFLSLKPVEPLTEDEIYPLYNEPRSDSEMVEFARAIESYHFGELK